jgi:hypothetical protein
MLNYKRLLTHLVVLMDTLQAVKTELKGNNLTWQGCNISVNLRGFPNKSLRFLAFYLEIKNKNYIFAKRVYNLIENKYG